MTLSYRIILDSMPIEDVLHLLTSVPALLLLNVTSVPVLLVGR